MIPLKKKSFLCDIREDINTFTGIFLKLKIKAHYFF